MPKVKETRKFGGKSYKYKVSTFKKERAAKMATGLRRRGYKVRVHKDPAPASHPSLVGYDIYARKP